MLLVTLDSDDYENAGSFVYIGAVAHAIARAKGSVNVLDAERILFGLVNAAVQFKALNPRDPENLMPLSKSDYGHGIVALEELVAWGHSLSPPLDFNLAQNSVAPVAVGAAVAPAPECPARMTEAERQRGNEFFAESSRRRRMETDASADERARLRARDEYEASKPPQQPAPAAPDQTEAVVPASDEPEIPKNKRSDLLTPLINKAQRDEPDPCAVFLAMENIAASEVSIAFVGDKGEQGLVLGANNLLEVSVRGTKKRIPLGSLDLIDKRQGTLNSQGVILLGMAGKKRLPNNTANSKKVQRLRRALSDNLSIKGDPFQPFRKDTGWSPLFTLTDNRGAADKRAKDRAEYRQPSIEQMNMLGRHFAAPEQPHDSTDRGERANQRRQDFPADDWMQKNGHSYGGDDYDQDN